MSWLIITAIVPIVVAWMNGSTYTYAFSLVGVGVALYVANTLLIGKFVARRAPETLENDPWEDTAGTRIVPTWVPVIGLIGMGFVPAGLVVAVLLGIGLIANRAGV
jgi:heme/copper-type cytochrome/quinol oxidase subunit 2